MEIKEARTQLSSRPLCYLTLWRALRLTRRRVVTRSSLQEEPANRGEADSRERQGD